MLLLEDSGKTNKVTMGADVTHREEKIHHGERRENWGVGVEQIGTGRETGVRGLVRTCKGIFKKLFFCMWL